MSNPIKILLANDSAKLLDSWNLLLKDMPELEVHTAQTLGEIDDLFNKPNPPQLVVSGLSLSPGDYPSKSTIGSPSSRAREAVEFLERQVASKGAVIATTSNFPSPPGWKRLDPSASAIRDWVRDKVKGLQAAQESKTPVETAAENGGRSGADYARSSSETYAGRS